MGTKSENLVQLPLDSIFVDYSWNSRSEHDVTSSQSDGVLNEGMKEGNGFQGLCASIQLNGQDNPVTVRPIKDRRPLGGGLLRIGAEKFTHELVCGFRRVTALRYLFANKIAVPGLQDGHVKAIVRELDPLEARLLNLRENTDRASLSPPDLVWGIFQLRAKGFSNVQVAEALNIHPVYVSKLAKITTLPLEILEHWRTGKTKLPGIPTALNGEPIPTRLLPMTKLLEISDMVADSNEKISIYVNSALGRKPIPTVSSTSDHVEENVKEVALLAAEFVKHGVLKPGHLQWSAIIGPKRFGFLVSSGAPGSDPGGKLQKLWQLAQKTYEDALVMRTKKESE